MGYPTGKDPDDSQWQGSNSPSEQMQKLWQLLNRSVPAGSFAGIVIRVHITFFLLLAYQLATGESLTWTLRWTSALFISVLLHEFGHCFACRRERGQANEVLIWPLGGLAWCDPPFTARAHFITAAGGPAVNVVLVGLAWIILRVKDGAMMHVGFNPLSPFIGAPADYPSMFLGDVFIVNYILLVFNLAMVFYPFDGGRLIQATLWRFVGYTRSLYIAAIIGMVGASVVALLALWQEQRLVIYLALYGGYTSYQQLKQSREGSQDGGNEREWWQGDSAEANEGRRMTGKPRAFLNRLRSARQERTQARDAELEIQIDRILDKVASQGLASLTAKEKKMLKQETQRKRRVS